MTRSRFEYIVRNQRFLTKNSETLQERLDGRSASMDSWF